MDYPLVSYGKATVNLANLYMFNLLMAGAERERTHLRSLQTQVFDIVNTYADKFPKYTEEVTRLRLEIRLETKGIPVTEAMDPAAARPPMLHDPQFNEQQYNAFTELLKKAYRKAAALAHSDRGGNDEIFQEVKEAFKNRDLQALTAIFITLSAGRNLYWQQSDEGVEYASTEYERPKATRSLLQSSLVFAIARLHITGQAGKAMRAMEMHLCSEIQTLLTELQYLRNKNENQNQTRA